MKCHHDARVYVGLDAASAIPVCLLCRKAERAQIAAAHAEGQRWADATARRLTAMGDQLLKTIGVQA